MDHVKVVVEKHPDGYAAYPLGVTGVVVGEGDTAEEAIGDVTSGRASGRCGRTAASPSSTSRSNCPTS